MQKIYNEQRREAHVYKGSKPSEGHPPGSEIHLVLIIPAKRIKIHGAHVLRPCPHSYTEEDREIRVLDPKGLVGMNLGTQDLDKRS